VDLGSKRFDSAAEADGPRRLPVRGSARIECRKGTLGLGPNLAEAALDMCASEARVLLKEPLPKGIEVELIIHGAGSAPVRRLGKVVATAPLDDGKCVVRVTLEGSLSYAELQRLTRPAQTLR
jgi:hypothetical protein